MLDFNSFYQISRLFLNELAFQSFLRIPQLQHWIHKGYRFSTPVGGLERKSTYINTCRWIGSLLLEDKYFGKLNSHTSLPQPPPQPHPPELPGIEHLMAWRSQEFAHRLTTNKLHFNLQPSGGWSYKWFLISTLLVYWGSCCVGNQHPCGLRPGEILALTIYPLPTDQEGQTWQPLPRPEVSTCAIQMRSDWICKRTESGMMGSTL